MCRIYPGWNAAPKAGDDATRVRVKTSIAVTTRAHERSVHRQYTGLARQSHDDRTLSGYIEQVERLTDVAVERGNKGYKHGGRAKVYIGHTRGLASPTIKRELVRRYAIEPIIGHTKSYGLGERNHLAVPQEMPSTPFWSPPDIRRDVCSWVTGSSSLVRRSA